MTVISNLTMTLGELIRHKRQQKQMTLAQVSDLTGVSKGTISKIENKEIKLRDYKVALDLATVLDIPIEDVTERYIEVERNPDYLLDALGLAISQSASTLLTAKIAAQFLTTNREPTEDSLQKLYEFTTSLQDNSQKLALYQVISKIADDHSVRPLLAKSLLQTYLIQRDNFKKLRESYTRGTDLLHHARFLQTEDQILYYYKLGAHAYHLGKYRDCIRFFKELEALDTSDSPSKAHAVCCMAFCYCLTGQYELTEEYIKAANKFNFPFVQEHVAFTTAKLNVKKGNIDLAIIQFEHCLDSYLPKVAVMDDLLDLYLQQHNLAAAEQLFHHEHDFEDITLVDNPALVAKYANYYATKSRYYKFIMDQNQTIHYLLKSIMLFISVDRRSNVSEGAGLLLNDLCKSPKTLDNIEIIDKIELVASYLKILDYEEGDVS